MLCTAVASCSEATVSLLTHGPFYIGPQCVNFQVRAKILCAALRVEERDLFGVRFGDLRIKLVLTRTSPSKDQHHLLCKVHLLGQCHCIRLVQMLAGFFGRANDKWVYGAGGLKYTLLRLDPFDFLNRCDLGIRLGGGDARCHP